MTSLDGYMWGVRDKLSWALWRRLGERFRNGPGDRIWDRLSRGKSILGREDA